MIGSGRFKVAVMTGLLVLVAAFGSHCQAKMYTTCTGICGGVPPCNESYDDCLMGCAALQDKCDRVGHPATFLAYLTCTTDGGFSCDEAGQPVATALCEQEQADLVQCDTEGDAALEIPDGAFEADTPCADAGDCLECCKDHHVGGARMYATFVTECLCAPGTCQSACAAEACAGDAQMQPQPNDPCDECVSTALNDLVPDAGACVIPVTLQCNQVADCALFVNCATQAGCEP
jgi:hypothetical protein